MNNHHSLFFMLQVIVVTGSIVHPISQICQIKSITIITVINQSHESRTHGTNGDFNRRIHIY